MAVTRAVCARPVPAAARGRRRPRHAAGTPLPWTGPTRPGWRTWHPPVRLHAALPGSRLRVTVLVPAHNEESQIEDGLGSLLGQTRPPDRIVVVCDNCTDRTAEIATAVAGVEIVRTIGNRDRKAGALNQVLDVLLPDMDIHDTVLVMDADSALDPRFIEAGLARLATGAVSAVGGTFSGKPGGGLVGLLQRNEYARYARDVRRQRGQTLVLTGTAALFRAEVLYEVVAARRSHRLPGRAQVYDTRVLTEDNELTLAILTLGRGVIAPAECTLLTEVMPTWRQLFRQRLRWKRGALENLAQYGMTSVTAEYWVRQVVAFVGLLAMAAYLGALAWALIAQYQVHLHPLWMAITGLFALERAITVRRRGPLMMALAAGVVVEMLFDLFIQAAQATAFLQAALQTERRW
jgi:cellulose synthase/poly-beta-1,6-N-acetylglucosamine synthase-like glycosyltransferase